MAEDAFERAVHRHERLERSERRVRGRRFFASMLVGGTVGVGVAVTLAEGGFEAISPVIVIFPIAAAVMGLFVARGGLKVSPLWHAGTLDGLRVQGAVLTGRAVGRRELAGLAVSTAQYARGHRWMGIVATLCAVSVALLLGSVLGWLGWALGAAVLAPAAAILGMGINAARAEAANRALLDR